MTTAKSFTPGQIVHVDRWFTEHEVRYIGVMSNGRIAIEYHSLKSPDDIFIDNVPASHVHHPKVKKEGWVNIFSSSKGRHFTGEVYNTKEDANLEASECTRLQRLDCIEIEYKVEV